MKINDENLKEEMDRVIAFLLNINFYNDSNLSSDVFIDSRNLSLFNGSNLNKDTFVDNESLNLLNKYFCDEKYILNLLGRIEEEENFSENDYLKILENIFNMYPLSKKFFSYFVKREKLCNLYGMNFSLAEKALLSSLNKYLNSLNLLFLEGKNEEEIKNSIEEIKNKSMEKKANLNKKINLEKTKKEILEILENKKLKNDVKDLEDDIEKINCEIDELENARKIKAEEKENLLNHLNELKLDDIGKKEEDLINQLSNLWFK